MQHPPAPTPGVSPPTPTLAAPAPTDWQAIARQAHDEGARLRTAAARHQAEATRLHALADLSFRAASRARAQATAAQVHNLDPAELAIEARLEERHYADGAGGA